MPELKKIEAVLSALADGSYFQRLLHAPSPHLYRKPPELLFHHVFAQGPAVQTVVVPAFNHADTIARCIACAAASITAPTDFIFIDDASDDGTAERIVAAAKAFANKHVADVTVLRNPAPIYETACDNIGFTLAETPFIIELQADIEIREPGFDALFSTVAASQLAPAAISGRCGHTFELLVARSDIVRDRVNAIGLSGENVETPERAEPLRGRVFQCETVNRGPWMVMKADLDKHGYLDEKNFFLGNDDHDYHRRLYQAEGRRPVYVPIRMVSPLARGATRRPRSGRNLEIFQLLLSEKQGSPEFWDFVRTYRPIHYPREIALQS